MLQWLSEVGNAMLFCNVHVYGESTTGRVIHKSLSEGFLKPELSFHAQKMPFRYLNHKFVGYKCCASDDIVSEISAVVPKLPPFSNAFFWAVRCPNFALTLPVQFCSWLKSEILSIHRCDSRGLKFYSYLGICFALSRYWMAYSSPTVPMNLSLAHLTLWTAPDNACQVQGMKVPKSTARLPTSHLHIH